MHRKSLGLSPLMRRCDVSSNVHSDSAPKAMPGPIARTTVKIRAEIFISATTELSGLGLAQGHGDDRHGGNSRPRTRSRSIALPPLNVDQRFSRRPSDW